MSGWLVETLVWTGALIALVLFVRRPVARVFGPRMAYALWALPMVRLLLPPITLPAWLAPAPGGTAASFPAEAALDTGGVETVPLTPDPSADEAGAGPFALFESLDWELLASAAFALWLVGAAVFLFVRFRRYFALRAALLADSREVGRVAGPRGAIRLIETPGTAAPLAFGVLDPVIALPPGFMARPDRIARDLALEHEIAHHRGHDLLINILVQPMFAAHWWSPLAHYGWLALRRDQEAACDARVIAARGEDERAAYASLIASTAAAAAAAAAAVAPSTAAATAAPNATGAAVAVNAPTRRVSPHTPITAPMACPVLGEQSIIHRLRSLKMSDASPRGCMVGRLALGAAVLALPLTASISYAEVASPQAQEAPPAPTAPVDAPPPPAAPQPPATPQPPAVPPRPSASEGIERIDPDTPRAQAGERQVMYEEESRYVTIVEREQPGEDGETRKVIVERVTDGDGKVLSEDVRGLTLGTRTEVMRGRRASGDYGDEEIEDIMVEVREGLAEADAALKELPAMLSMLDRDTGTVEHRTVVEMSCDPASDEVASTVTDTDGVRVVKLCDARVMAKALEGIRAARRSIAADREMPASTRRKILKELDRQIDTWENHAS